MDLIVLLLSTKLTITRKQKEKLNMGVIKNTILGIVGLAVVGGATAMAIPQSRNWCLDQIAKHSTIYKAAINERDDARADAKNKQETINNLNKTVAEKEQALKEAEELIATKNALIAEKDATIADKQKTIEEKDAEIVSKQSLIEAKDKTIAEKQATIDEQTTSINTLTTQKTSLLSAVTEIDNKINSTSDSVEIDNLEAKKTAILTQIEELDSQIETLTSQKTKLENDVKVLQTDKTQLQNEIDTLTADKTNLQNQVNSLTTEKTQLQQEVATLTSEKQNLQNQIDTLNSQLAEFEQYTLQIDQTNPVESITIEDTKLGTSATMSNVNITTLKLYSWQNATIKYASVEGSTIKATLNGTSQETDTVIVVGSVNKGASISIGSATQPIGKVAGLYKTGTDELTKSWSQLLADGDIKFEMDAMYGGNALVVNNKSLAGTLIIEPLDSLKILNMAFSDCNLLNSIDLSNVNTSEVTNMGNLFFGCSSLLNLDLTNFSTSSAVDIHAMFENCSALKNINLNSFDTSKATNFQQLFKNNSSLTRLDLSSFKTSQVCNMQEMFSGCSSLSYLDISSFEFVGLSTEADWDDMFTDVPADCEILVKDETAKSWLNTNFPTMTNVKIKTVEASA